MALSGTLTKTIGSNNRLRLEWSATQNISANTSTITTRLYWEATNSYGAIHSSAAKTATTSIAGNSTSVSFTAGLSANQSKLIQTKVLTVTHDSNGAKSVALSFNATLGLTITKVHYSSGSASGTATLDTIPRSSTGQISTWTFPNNPTVTISRASTSFTHTVELWLEYGSNSKKIATRTGIGASSVISLTVAENLEIANFARNNPSWYASIVKIKVTTFNGSTQIGSQTTSTVYAECRSYLATAASISPSSVNPAESITATLSRDHSSFIHRVELSSSPSDGVGLIASFSNVSTSQTINLANYSTEIQALIRSNASALLYVKVHTYYNTVTSGSTNKIRTMEVSSFTVTASNPPVWGSGSLSYADIISSTVAITGSNQVLVKSKSTARISIPVSALASGQGGATISSYTLSLGTFTQTWNASNMATSVDIPITTLTSNTNAILTSTDSRGNTSSRSIALTIRDYSTPTMTSRIGNRQSTDEGKVDLTINGSFAKVAGSNNISNAYWGLTTGTRTNAMTPSFNLMNGTWSATSIGINLSEDLTQTYYFIMTDRFGGQITGSVTVNRVQPIFFIDPDLSSIGVNKYPEQGYAADIAGKGRFSEGLVTTEISASKILGDITNTGSHTFNRNTDSGQVIIDPTSNSYNAKVALKRAGTLYGELYSLYSTDDVYLKSLRGRLMLQSNSGVEVDSTLKASKLISALAGISSTFGDFTGTVDAAVISATGRIYGDTVFVGGNLLISSNGNQTVNTTGNWTFRNDGGGIAVTAGTNAAPKTIYLQGQEIRAVRPLTTSTYIPVYGSSFTNPSKREYKKDIVPFELSMNEKTALEEVLTTPIRNYKYLDDKEADLVRTGVIVDEAPADIITLDGEGVDLYSMISILWRAVQEMNEQVQ